MKALLKSTQIKCIKIACETKAQRGHKTILDYDDFHVNRNTCQKVQKIHICQICPLSEGVFIVLL